MKQAVALVHSYVPPDPQRIQAAKAAGNLAMSPTGRIRCAWISAIT